MYLADLLDVLEKELGLSPGAGSPVGARENVILAEIRRLRRAPAKRVPAASRERLAEVRRAVANEMLDGATAAAVARAYGISETQARRLAGEEIQLACRRMAEQGKGQATFRVATYDWIASTGRDACLGRARSNLGLAHAALEALWNAQDERRAR